MGSINRVTLMGVVGNPPELKFSRNGKPFVRLSVATHKRIKDTDGGSRRETQWHSVMLWGKIAEICSLYCEKGAPVYVEGHLTSYTKIENGTKFHQLAIMGDQVQFIPGTRIAHQVAERIGDQPEHGELEAALTSMSPPVADASVPEEAHTTLN